MQEDKVETLARNLWRKRQSGYYRKECVEYRERVLRIEEVEIECLIKFLEDVEAGKQISELRLPKKWAEFYRKHFPRKDYESDAARLEMVSVAVGEALEALFDRRGKLTKELVVKRFCDERVIAEELALEGRIDAKIDRDLIALGRMKTMQQMGLGGRSGSTKEEKRIDLTATRLEAPQDKVDREE